MANLFSEQSGFRLKRLEMFNWGTFDGEIYAMTPEGETSVLTGPNGSGKSTIVDALLTLLIESRQRNYNLASGASSSRERSERSYVRGEYSRSRGDTAFEAIANTLRGTDAHSTLLAVFYDAAQNRTVTLAQTSWISGADKMDRRFCVAPMELTIAEHIPGRFMNARDLPKGAQVFGNIFKDYIAAARKALGLAGREKALPLFNETVAVKDIPSLNTFVRDHMLNKDDPESKVEGLRAQYRELNDAYAAIQRAARQLDILAPLVRAGREYRYYEDQKQRYEAAKSLVPFYVAEKTRVMVTEALTALEAQRDAAQSQFDTVKATLQQLREQLNTVMIAIAQDDVGQMKREIEGKIPLVAAQRDSKSHAAKRYEEYAVRLELAPYRDEQSFYENRVHIQAMLDGAAVEIGQLEQERSEAQFQQRDLRKQCQQLEQEIQHLRANPSNIPATDARIREGICQALNLGMDDLPFVGELLKVNRADSGWEGALERLLNSTARTLIVPESEYARVSRYVNVNNLQGKLVYQRVNPAQRYTGGPERTAAAHGALAYDKLQIRPDTPYKDWLAASLSRRFDYVCCESLAEFQTAERALTREGQIKHSRTRHEKDDRRRIDDRQHYVLGWDNRDKLRQVEAEFAAKSRELHRLEESITRIEDSLQRKRGDVTALHELLRYEDFADIDWRVVQAELDRLQRQLSELQQQSDQLRRLEQQRADLQAQIAEQESTRDKVNRSLENLESRIGGLIAQREAAERRLATATDEHQHRWESVGQVIEDLDRDPVSIDRLVGLTDRLTNSLQSSINNFSRYQGDHSVVISDAMTTFRREYPEEGVTLTVDLRALAAYEAIHQRLESDDLPRYSERFKNLLDRKVTSSIRQFTAYLESREREIQRSIDELNESLARVDYGSGSTIRLISQRSRDREISDFRGELRACIPDAGDDSIEELQRAYGRIKALIERFNSDPNWMQRVIDVRRWQTFAAEQIDAEGRQIDYYDDSAGKSGGQKAKLAYTILASAIAYQYGLQEIGAGERSFRFVVIDEAFSKLDDDNARYAMELFKQLGLQLLVVTPMQQLHIIEDYVKVYHLVVNNSEGNHSELYNLTQTEYRERRREWAAQGIRSR